jgi:hypothetical protein
LISRGPAPADAAACVKIYSAPVATYAPLVSIADTKVTPGPDGLGVTVSVQNSFKTAVLASIMVTYFDAKGAILARPFVVETFPAEAKRPLSFTGPKNAVRAQAFVGAASI